MATSTNPPRRGCLVVGQKIALSVLILLFIVVSVLLIVASKAKTELQAAYPAPGQLVDLGGYQLHLLCQGSGQPTVILEAGQGNGLLTWSRVQPEVAAFTRVCAYDRAGLGWSDPSPKPRIAPMMVEELHSLLGKAGIAPPYVLVGHSMGGMYARLFAHTYPGEVAGLVLVDASSEYQTINQSPALQAAEQQALRTAQSQVAVLKPLIAVGVMALMPAIFAEHPKLPEAARQTTEALLATRQVFLQTKLDEFQANAESTAQVRAVNITSLGDIPLRILTRSNDTESAEKAGLSATEAAQLEQTWQQWQADFTKLSARSVHTVVPNSRHDIHLDQPDAVIDAIRTVLTDIAQS